MGYALRGFVTRPEALAAAGRALPSAELAQGLVLVPLTDDLHDELQEQYGGGRPHVFQDAFFHLAAGVVALAERASTGAPVAYVEVDFFGGTGTQAVVVWLDGAVVLGPLHEELRAAGPGSAPEAWPVNAALHALGATSHGQHDAFAAVGLGRYRRLEDWPV